MSKAAYIGVGDKARKIKAIYVGDENGKARRVTAGYVGVGGVARQFFASGGILGELDVGQTVKMNVSGVPKEFLVVHQGRPSEKYNESYDGTWLLMKENFSNCIWTAYSISTDYRNSNFAKEEVPKFLNALDEGVRNIIISAYTSKAFPLSAGEVGLESSSDGAKLDYFLDGYGDEANERRVEAGRNSWWLRTTVVSDAARKAYVVNASGSTSTVSVGNRNGFRPALILPKETRVSEDGTIIV